MQNTGPTISGTPPPVAQVGSVWSFSAEASDPDGDALSFSVENAPGWTNFDPAIGRLSGTPDAGDLGPSPDIRIAVSDGTSSAALEPFIITVTATPLPGALAVYTFSEGAGDRVLDTSGAGEPLDLTIEDPDVVTWLPGGGLAINDVTRIVSPGPAEKITTAVQQSNAFSLEAWIVPLSIPQDGPARIVTISENPFVRNFTLGQVDSSLSVRFRTSTTDENGRPDLMSNADVVGDGLMHLVFTRDAEGASRIYRNGEVVGVGEFLGDSSNWDAGHRLALGNEVEGGSRPWLGTFRQLAIYDRALDAEEVTANFTASIDPDNQSPVATFSFSPDGAEGPVTIGFDAGASSDPDGRITQYVWDFGDGNTEVTNVSVASHSYTSAGSYTVGLTVRDNDGASDTTTQPVSVTAPVPRLANVRWTAPTSNVDGSALTDLVGYQVRHGSAPGQYTETVAVSVPATSAQITVTGSALYLVVSAVNAAGVESRFSGEVAVDTANLDPA